MYSGKIIRALGSIRQEFFKQQMDMLESLI